MIETVPCETCGEPTAYKGTKRCNNCWEVEHRLEDYMRSPKALEVIRNHLPLLDDWADGKPDAWDYETVLRDHNVTVEWCDKAVDGEGRIYPLPSSVHGWGFFWKQGAIHIGQTTETIARKAAALFVSLWLRKVSASFCDKLMDGFIIYLERQEQTSLTLPVEIERITCGPVTALWVGKGPGRRCLNLSTTHQKIIDALDPQEDDEIIVTFTKRRQPHADQ